MMTNDELCVNLRFEAQRARAMGTMYQAYSPQAYAEYQRRADTFEQAADLIERMKGGDCDGGGKEIL